MSWALEHSRDVHFFDWPAAVSLADRPESKAETPAALTHERDPDPLDQVAEAAGYSDGEAFWNALIEQPAVQQVRRSTLSPAGTGTSGNCTTRLRSRTGGVRCCVASQDRPAVEAGRFRRLDCFSYRSRAACTRPRRDA